MLKWVNLFFTIVFILECGLKLIAFGPYVYFFDGWRQFDFFVVSCSFIDIALAVVDIKTMKFLKVGP